MTFDPLAGAVSKVSVVPETVKSSTGCNFLPSFLIDNKCTLDGEPDNVNACVEPSPVNVLVDDTVGLFNLFEIAKALIRFKSITGDKLAFEELNVKFTTIDFEPDITFVWLISLATNLGLSKYKLSPSTTFSAAVAACKLNAVSE